ncbi:MAG: response regulator [Bdellovibrionaceae bacterium]|nr:response regulator [Pseudobdellovibrionaceae bacterium]|tara:strand:+ start:4252 stop:4689 length:438 start_codon:yes stop_codon:yes gene_type:complete
MNPTCEALMFPSETRVLIVDDLKTIRNILSEILKKIGLKKVDQCGDGKQALVQLKKASQEGDPFGLIICDWNMPELTGLELLNAKNNDNDLKNTPFLMVTIESEKDYVLKAIAMGVDDFVVKPFNEQIITKKLENVWERTQGKQV